MDSPYIPEPPDPALNATVENLIDQLRVLDLPEGGISRTSSTVSSSSKKSVGDTGKDIADLVSEIDNSLNVDNGGPSRRPTSAIVKKRSLLRKSWPPGTIDSILASDVEAQFQQFRSQTDGPTTDTSAMLSTPARSISSSSEAVSVRDRESETDTEATQLIVTAPTKATYPPLKKYERRFQNQVDQSARVSFRRKPRPEISSPIPLPASQRLPLEILMNIMLNLRSKRDFLSCALSCRAWTRPSLASWRDFKRTHPYVGMSLVAAFRKHFSNKPTPPPSLRQFDQDLYDLANLYTRSNPGTIIAFHPNPPPDLFYPLFWTLLFIDQEFRNPRIHRQVSCSYFVRLVMREGGYPQEVFGKAALRAMYSDIKREPLLPPPHTLRSAVPIAPGYVGGGPSSMRGRIEEYLKRIWEGILLGRRSGNVDWEIWENL